MPRIQVLGPHIANQIAAGEVVERPASIVKELVENAVDAGASAVTVEIENGGIDGIRITDNGCGIESGDVETAFLRHATSKIRTADDLTHIETLGFRGEALASIAAVSCVTMQTRTQDAEAGTQICVRGGEIVSKSPAGCPNGTCIEVRELFYNAPARLKFLKSARAEGGAIGDYIAKLILSLPGVSFRYISNGKNIYQSTGDGDLKNAIVTVYGVSAAPHLCSVAFDDGYLKIDGYAGTPELSRFNRSAQSFFLNRRIIRSAALSNALSRAFDTRLMIGRFPFAVLALQIAPAEVDVNVHPAKLEVRFRDEQRVARSLNAACADALIRSYVPAAERQAAPAAAAPLCRMPDISESYRHTQGAFAAPPRGKFVELRTEAPEARLSLRESAGAVPHYRMDAPSPAPEPIISSASFDTFEVIGCAFSTYWMIQQGDVLYCIDQHAAHERLLYDALMQREAPVVSQALLFPEDVALTESEAALAERYSETLKAFGFVLTEQDALCVTLLAVPQINGTAMKGEFLHDALQHMEQSGDGTITDKDFMRKKLIQTACKHAVKGGEPLTKPEIERLLRALSENDALLTCPHGRPVAVRITRTDLEKTFKRIQ